MLLTRQRLKESLLQHLYRWHNNHGCHQTNHDLNPKELGLGHDLKKPSRLERSGANKTDLQPKISFEWEFFMCRPMTVRLTHLLQPMPWEIWTVRKPPFLCPPLSPCKRKPYYYLYFSLALVFEIVLHLAKCHWVIFERNVNHRLGWHFNPWLWIHGLVAAHSPLSSFYFWIHVEHRRKPAPAISLGTMNLSVKDSPSQYLLITGDG